MMKFRVSGCYWSEGQFRSKGIGTLDSLLPLHAHHKRLTLPRDLVLQLQVPPQDRALQSAAPADPVVQARRLAKGRRTRLQTLQTSRRNSRLPRSLSSYRVLLYSSCRCSSRPDSRSLRTSISRISRSGLPSHSMASLCSGAERQSNRRGSSPLKNRWAFPQDC
jgi:hypothetical protein